MRCRIRIWRRRLTTAVRSQFDNVPSSSAMDTRNLSRPRRHLAPAAGRRPRLRVVLATTAGALALSVVLGTAASHAAETTETTRAATPEQGPDASSGEESLRPAAGLGVLTSLFPEEAFDVSEHSTTDPESIWVLVNKRNPIEPAGFVPPDLRAPQVRIIGQNHLLREEAAQALEAMAEEIEQETGAELAVLSGYRSAAYQESLYGRYVSQYGRESADAFSARAGHSEHQTGLAVDVTEVGSGCDLRACFAETSTGAWLADHAWQHGFVIRYPDDAEDVTGYMYEPWHLRYVGVDLAEHMREEQIVTLEEALEAGAAPAYE